jgi:hypothetical protein
VHAFRFLLARRHLALLICAAALLVKLLVPAGYMVDSGRGSLTLSVCSGVMPRTIVVEVAGLGGGGAAGDQSHDQGKAELPCAFSGLSAASLGAIDPIQLAGLIAFVMAVGLTRGMLRPPSDPARLRPPLRGPPGLP